MNTKELDNTYIAHTYGRFDLELVRGKGSVVFDEKGKKYIDLGSGIAVTTFGIADDEWQKAVTEQLGTLQHASNLYYTGPCAKLAQMLCERTGMKKVFFSNSGAEANECAIKAARKYAEMMHPGRENVIITLENSFHGRTITTLSATGQDTFHKDFLPMTAGFVHASANDIAALTALFEQYDVAGFMFEAVQGEGGVLPLEKDFVQAAAELCKKYDALLISDEVQTGNGRTGMLYGYMNFGVTPDVVSTAKGLAGGLPLGATLLGEKAAQVFTPGSHGSTFGGNPVCCAGAMSILSRIDEALMADVREKSALVFDTLTGADGIKSVTGMGLMIGIETQGDAGDIVNACMEAGVLVLKAKNKVRLLPALNIPKELLSQALDIIKTACAKAVQTGGQK